jgi:hypothetical protein
MVDELMVDIAGERRRLSDVGLTHRLRSSGVLRAATPTTVL